MPATSIILKVHGGKGQVSMEVFAAVAWQQGSSIYMRRGRARFNVGTAAIRGRVRAPVGQKPFGLVESRQLAPGARQAFCGTPALCWQMAFMRIPSRFLPHLIGAMPGGDAWPGWSLGKARQQTASCHSQRLVSSRSFAPCAGAVSDWQSSLRTRRHDFVLEGLYRRMHVEHVELAGMHVMLSLQAACSLAPLPRALWSLESAACLDRRRTQSWHAHAPASHRSGGIRRIGTGLSVAAAGTMNLRRHHDPVLNSRGLQSRLIACPFLWRSPRAVLRHRAAQSQNTTF